MNTNRGKRNQSCLIPYDRYIRQARNQNPPVSYAKICEYLLTTYNLAVCRGTVFNYVKVRSKEPTYYKMLPSSEPKTVVVQSNPETEQEAIRRAQWEEKQRVDQSRAESEAKLKALDASNAKKPFFFDPSKPMQLRQPTI